MPLVGIDGAGLFVGDVESLPPDIGQRETFRGHFGTPMRRAKTMARGLGFVIDVGDGSYDTTLSTSGSSDAGPPFVCMQRYDAYVSIVSGTVTACDVLYLINRRADDRADQWDHNKLCLSVDPGCYSIQISCGVYPAARDGLTSRGITTEANERRLIKAKGERMFGSMSAEELAQITAEVEASKFWYIDRIACVLSPVEKFPTDWDVDDPVFEFLPSRESLLEALNWP